jgi:hypothetical protein
MGRGRVGEELGGWRTGAPRLWVQHVNRHAPADTLMLVRGPELAVHRCQSDRFSERVRSSCATHSRRTDVEGVLRNQTSRESLECDPENGSRSDEDSAVMDGLDRQFRFDLTEGHDLERLLWPGMGRGDSTGLLQNSPSTAGASRRTDSLNRCRCASSSTEDHRTCIGKMSVRHHRAKADDNGIAYRPREKKSGPTADAMGPEDSVRLPGILRMLRGPAFRPRPCRGPVRGPVRAGAPGAR